MRILYVITSTTLGGAEKTLHSLIAGVNREKYTPVAVISLKPRGPVAGAIEAPPLNVPVRTLSMGYMPLPWHLSRLKTAIAEFKPDIVHAFLFRAIQFCRLAQNGSFKLIESPRVNYRTRARPVLALDRITRKDNLVICESSASRDFLLKNQGYAASQVAVIRNGIDMAAWAPSHELREQTRHVADIRDGQILVCAAGRLDEQKGYPYLIKAMALVKRKNPAVKLIIAGGGPLKKGLLDIIESLGLRDTVRLIGEQPSALPWLNAADIFALPSLWEGIPNSLLEAMSVGAASVASAVDGVPEAAQDGKEALLVPPASQAALAEAILKLAGNAELRAKLAEAARERIRRDFSLAAMAANYENIYDKVNGGRI